MEGEDTGIEVRLEGLPRYERLRCGVIVTDRFVRYLIGRYWGEYEEHLGQVLAAEYVRVEDGRAWWNLVWVARRGIPAHNLIPVGEGLVELAMSRDTQKGLRERVVDVDGGRVVVG
jgi:hypothetical protein